MLSGNHQNIKLLWLEENLDTPDFDEDFNSTFASILPENIRLIIISKATAMREYFSNVTYTYIIYIYEGLYNCVF